jgi:hypothetical protein
MKIAIAGKTLDRGDGMTVGSKRWNDAAVHRFPIKQDRTSAAIARIATFLDAEMSEFTKKGSQTLPGPRLPGMVFAIDQVARRHIGFGIVLRYAWAGH